MSKEIVIDKIAEAVHGEQMSDVMPALFIVLSRLRDAMEKDALPQLDDLMRKSFEAIINEEEQ